MRKDLQDKLYEDFPSLYKNRNQSRSPMQFGFECDDGWEPIIRWLSLRLESLSEDIHAEQVKEKYGGLRFYVGGIPTAVAEEGYKSIDEAAEESLRTCEICGKPGKLNNDGWMKTVCKKHWDWKKTEE